MAIPVTSRDEELFLRESLWAELRQHPQWPDLPAEVLRGLKIYSGQAGIYSDMSRTRSLAPTGVAVSVLHTGRHYADDLDDDGIIYHYPTTGRMGHDQSEIESVKTAQQLGLPIFVIVQKGRFRRVKRAWVSDSDDVSRLFLLEFADIAPAAYVVEPDRQDLFIPRVARPQTLTQVMRRERSSRFKFESLKRYGSKCVLSGLSVVEMLDGAHVIPVDKGGSDDPRNGLLLSASLHRALDANLWAINPKTLEIETRTLGPSLSRMKIAVNSLNSAPVLPHLDALEFRYDLFLKAG
jgi:hypothetical protein